MERRNRFRNRRQGKKRFNSSALNPSLFISVPATTPVAPVEKIQTTGVFSDFNLDPLLFRNLTTKGFISPTPIQKQSIPVIMDGKNIVGIANTGTGKTGAFIIPLIDRIYREKQGKVLVIAPTRELAEQIEKEIYSLTKDLYIRSVLCVGGMNISGQIMKLRGSYQFLVATPGRLLDLTKRREIDMKNFSTIVLDEVDRMLDMGFIHDIKTIISMLPAQKQSLFFSATLNMEIETIINSFMPEYVKVSVKTGNTAANVHQDVIYYASQPEKTAKLEELLQSVAVQKAIVFVRTKRGVEHLDKHLFDKGYSVHSLHGNKSQSKRKRALDAFKKGHAKILVATDVAARGIDVQDISHVINFDVPATYDDYVHRIGRTGRADKKGHALTFVEGRR